MKKSILFAIAAIIAITSCKKETETPSETKFTGPLVKIKVLSFPKDLKYNDTTTFFYDTHNRLVKTVYKNHNRFDTIIYESATVLKEKTYSLKRELLGTSEYSLNSRGYVELYTQTLEGNSTTMTFVYNTDGLVKLATSKESNSGRSDTTYYTYTNRNMVKSVSISWRNNTRDVDTLTFEHHLDIVSTIEYTNFGYSFFPNLNTNPIKSKKENGWHSDNFTYELDSKNRIIKETDKRAQSGNISWVETYEYVD